MLTKGATIIGRLLLSLEAALRHEIRSLGGIDFQPKI